MLCLNRPIHCRLVDCCYSLDYKTQDTLTSASGATQELLQSSATRAGSCSEIGTSNVREATSIKCPIIWYQSPQCCTAAKIIPISAVAIKMNRLSSNYTVQQSSAIRLADLEVQMTRVRTQVDSLEGATKRGMATADELDAARRELVVISRLRDDAETTRKIIETRIQREVFKSEFEESQRQTRLFERVASWQNVITYLVYIIMLLNVVVTTFGMSGDMDSPVSFRHRISPPWQHFQYQPQLFWYQGRQSYCYSIGLLELTVGLMLYVCHRTAHCSWLLNILCSVVQNSRQTCTLLNKYNKNVNSSNCKQSSIVVCLY